MKLDDYDKQQRYTATVISSERITPEESDAEVCEIMLEVDHKGLHIIECAPGVTRDDIRAATEAAIV